MGIFTVTYSFLWETLYPPVLRLVKHLEWGKVLNRPVQFLHDSIFISYADGATDPDYSNVTAYVRGDRVIFTNRGQYEALVSTTGNDPTDANFWLLVNDNYIGVRERATYNSQKIIFENSLNRWFQTTGIFITNNIVITNAFVMGATGPFSSAMSLNSINQVNFMGNVFTSSTEGDFTIFVPLAKFNSLAGNDEDRENVIRSFANIYVLAGLEYDVETF